VVEIKKKQLVVGLGTVDKAPYLFLAKDSPYRADVGKLVYFVGELAAELVFGRPGEKAADMV